MQGDDVTKNRPGPWDDIVAKQAARCTSRARSKLSAPKNNNKQKKKVVGRPRGDNVAMLVTAEYFLKGEVPCMCLTIKNMRGGLLTISLKSSKL